MTMRFEAAYARQSVEKKDSLSIRGQLELCQRSAGEKRLKLYQDQGYSGKNTRRPDFQRLLADIRSDRVSKLYVYRLDRFSRSIADFGQLWDILQEHEVEFVSVTESFDTSTPMGRAMLHIIMVFAQLERETTAERVRDNYAGRAALGAWPGGPAPYGFFLRRAAVTGGKSLPRLFPDGEKADVVRRIFRDYAREEMSLSKLAKELNGEKIPAPRREVWDSAGLSRLLHSPVYVRADREVYLFYRARGLRILTPEGEFDGTRGAFVFGRRAGDRSYRDREEQSLSLLRSEGLIPSELWLACQEKLQQNAQIKNSGRGRHSWLSGLLKCAGCGYSLKVQVQGEKRRLICSGRYNLARCSADIRISPGELEAAVEKELTRLLESCPPDPAREKGELPFSRELEALDRKADRLLDAFSGSGDMELTDLRRALERIQRERRELEARQKREGSRDSSSESLFFSRLSLEEKKLVAAQFIRRIELQGEEAAVQWAV